MKREEYLTGDVARFGEWLAQRLRGDAINFSVPDGPTHHTLYSAFTAYEWSLKNTLQPPPQPDDPPYVYPAEPPPATGTSYSANTKVLEVIRNTLRAAYAEGPNKADHLAGAVAAIFHWGGVYTKRGNRRWLASNYTTLFATLQAVTRDHAEGDDTSAVKDLRFNSGMTKVYSLLIDDFIIYDSRVAAALAWLAHRWWTIHCNRPTDGFPYLLRFGCLQARGNTERNPDVTLFKTLKNSPHWHYTWNIRANWLLAEALRATTTDSPFSSVREVEAALFQLGRRLASEQACQRERGVSSA